MAAYVQAVQQRADPAYHFRSDHRGFVADNDRHHFRARFRGDGFVLAGGEYELEVALSATACGHERAPVVGTVPRLEGSRLIQRHGAGLSSWYLNGPLGLEQGFTVGDDLACEDELSIVMDLGGLSPAREGAGIALRDPSGVVQLRYVGLIVEDDEGRSVPASLEASGQELRIAIDAAGFRFPLHVDPLWVEHTTLFASNGTSSDTFGGSVDVDGDSAAVGAWGTGASGRAYVFERVGGIWAEQASLSPTGGTFNEEFGRSVALSGDTLAVGAWKHDGSVGKDAGVVYTFKRTGGVWTQQQMLSPSDGHGDQNFGFSVSILGDTLFVGAQGDNDTGLDSGAVYVFQRSGGVWSQTQKLKPTNLSSFAQFGIAVDLAPGLAVVGAWGGSNPSPEGTAYVYRPTGGVWTQQAELFPTDISASDEYGFTVAADGDTVVIGAPDQYLSYADQGTSYVFVDVAGSWSLQQKLVSSNATAFDRFGVSVSIQGDTVVAGAPGANPLATSYVFERNAGIWSEQQLLVSPVSGDGFGNAVAIDGDTIFVGARWDDTVASNAGAVHVYGPPAALGEPCGQNTQCTTGFCVDGVCCDSNCGGGTDEDCQACSVNKGSSSDGQCETLPSGESCRPAAGECDLGEQCDGMSLTCPTDAWATDGTSCDGGTGVCFEGQCLGGAGGDGGAGTGGMNTGGSGPGEAGADGSGGLDGDAAGGNAVGGSGASTGHAAGGGDANTALSEEGGCGCAIPGGPRPRPLGWLVLLAWTGIRRRRRSSLHRLDRSPWRWRCG